MKYKNIGVIEDQSVDEILTLHPDRGFTAIGLKMVHHLGELSGKYFRKVGSIRICQTAVKREKIAF